MRIGFDISHSVGQRSGLGAYAIGLLQGLAAVDAEDEFLVYSFFYHRYPIRWRRVSIPEKPNFILNDPLFPGPVIRHLMGTRGSARSLWGNVEIVHSNSNVAPELRDSRLVFTLFDTTIYLFPETHTAANYDLVNRNLHRAARNAAAVIAISEQTKRDAQRFLHIPADRLFVVYPAAAKQ
ncbi:MAG TPA: glycosyltransferase, partial [Blastocatellia bacterium]|nr:glycosyltransferase [Blastocatellia bacterium]